ncbi:MAG: ectoine hydrolase DoeA, partial [Alphaproteobacteria bacterium]|nr:ectoine hydrolase DoeA [Alphaproteobacteria bacterium]
MTTTHPSFAVSEYADRIARTRTAMEARGVEVLIVSDPSNMAWLTGYDGWSFYVHQAVVLALTGAPLWWGRSMDALGARRTVFMDDDDISGYPDSFVQNPDKHPMEHLCHLIKAQGWAHARIGVEMDNYYFSAAAFQSLETGLARARFLDATGLVNWQRAVKSPAEIGYMRKAARIVENMHRVIAEKAEPGLAKNALVAEIYH